MKHGSEEKLISVGAVEVLLQVEGVNRDNKEKGLEVVSRRWGNKGDQ